MAREPNLQIIASLSTISFTGTVYRCIPERLQGRVLSADGNRLYHGRYHSMGDSGVLYTSLKQDVAIAEVVRKAPAKQLKDRYIFVAIRMRLTRVLDLTHPSHLKAMGIAEELLVQSDYTLCQAISLVARREGFEGLTVPSATRSGKNLILFTNNLGLGSSISVVSVEPANLAD